MGGQDMGGGSLPGWRLLADNSVDMRDGTRVHGLTTISGGTNLMQIEDSGLCDGCLTDGSQAGSPFVLSLQGCTGI